MTGRLAIAATAIVVLLALGCDVLVTQPMADPWLPAELALFGLFGAWSVHAAREVRHSGRLTRGLPPSPAVGHVDGVTYSVLPGESFQAFVVGLVRPRIWLSRRFLDVLGPAELRAVLFHEEHHRRTRAPMRTAAIIAQIRTFGRIPVIRRLLEDRLALIETQADVFALRNGVTQGALARALLVADRKSPLPAFSGGAEIRVRHLLDPESFRAPRLAHIPFEWAFVALPAAALIACHLAIR